MSTNIPIGNPNGSTQNGQEQPKDQPNNQSQVQNGAPDGKQSAPTGQAQDIFTKFRPIEREVNPLEWLRKLLLRSDRFRRAVTDYQRRLKKTKRRKNATLKIVK